MRPWGSCSSTGRRGCIWCWPAGRIRRCRWRGCEAVASWRSCAPPSCGSPSRRRLPCCGRRPAPACPMRWRRPWRPAPKGGPRGCSWPGCRCGGRPMRPGLWRRSAAATGTCWTTWPMRCLRARPSRCAGSCWRPRCWSGCRGSCVMRSPAAPVARRCWSRWSGRACSWRRWMRCVAGGATTTCSPTCSAPACRRNSPARWCSCTATRRPGVRGMGCLMTRSGTRWPPGRWSGPPG